MNYIVKVKRNAESDWLTCFNRTFEKREDAISYALKHYWPEYQLLCVCPADFQFHTEKTVTDFAMKFLFGE